MTFDDADLPRQFGSYLLKQKIARGGMAELYLAETRGPGGFVKPMVLKMVHGQFSEDDRFLAMFTDEAKILSGLSHGNIVPIFDFGRNEGVLYLAMEFIDGADVATLLDTCRLKGIPLSLDVALWIGIGAAAGLSHVHQARDTDGQPLGVIHRDVSPQNILTSRSGEVKLCDFGIAVSAIREGDTDSGVIKGKLRYFSPEQARADEIDARSDIFSLGVVLYELIVGHHPVPSGADVTVLRALSGDGYPSLAEAAPWIPPAVAAAVDRAISFDPADRFDTAEDLRGELSRILYQEHPDFAPERLADLVADVQTANEESEARDIDGIIRARLASFASATRETTGQRTERATLRRIRRGWSRTPGRIVALSFLVLASLFFGTISVWNMSRESTSPADNPIAPASPAQRGEEMGRPGSEARKSDASGVAAAPAGPTDQKDSGAREVDAGTPTTTETPLAATTNRPKRRAQGLADINASPWAEVRVDGTDRGTTPIIGLKLPAGRHRAVFSNPELGVSKKRNFVVRAGETTRLIVEME